MRLVHPSPQFPASPALSLAVPEGWEPVALPAALLAAHKPHADEPGARASVHVSVSRHSDDWTLDAESEALEARLSATHEAELQVVPSPPVTVPDDAGVRSWVLRRTDPEAGPLVQLFVAIHVPQGHVADVVHVVGTVAGQGEQEDFEELKAVVRSVEVTVGGPAAAGPHG
jgi:hypothetical protein